MSNSSPSEHTTTSAASAAASASFSRASSSSRAASRHSSPFTPHSPKTRKSPGPLNQLNDYDAQHDLLPLSKRFRPSSPPYSDVDGNASIPSTGDYYIPRPLFGGGPGSFRPPFDAKMSDHGSLGGLLDEQAMRLDDGDPERDGDSSRSVMAPDTPSYYAGFSPGELFASGGSDPATSGPASVRDEEPAAVPAGSRPSPGEELAEITALKNEPLRHTTDYYLVSRAWYRRWNAYACGSGGEGDDALPGPVDCSDLLDPTTSKLAPALQEGSHFEILPKKAWELLKQWHGRKGPEFFRTTLSGSDPVVIEVYQTRLTFVALTHDVKAESQQQVLASRTISISKAHPLEIVAQLAHMRLHVPRGEEVRIWSCPPGTKADDLLAGLTPSTITAADSGYTLLDTTSRQPLASITDRVPWEEMPIVVEVASPDGVWPTEAPNSAPAAPPAPKMGIFALAKGQDSFSKLQKGSGSGSGGDGVASTSTAPSTSTSFAASRVTRSQTAAERVNPNRPRGLKGLQNLADPNAFSFGITGNTCFLASAVQCLSNTPELKEYFVSRVFEQEINTDNVLGTGGALVTAFGQLINILWSPSGGTSYAPRDFKWSLAKFAPQFSGYGQQDTQELLAFLLDGLHEDLNRIIKKPYIEAPDWQGGGLEEMVRFARRQWEIYRMRNDSVIVDLFQGQYRSTLVCPVCDKVSIKFDPFMYLTLPLPDKRLWRHTVFFVPADPSEPVKRVNMVMPGESSMSKLKSELAELFNVEGGASKIIGAETWKSKFYRLYYDYEPVTIIERADHAWFWELPCDFAPPPSEFMGIRSSGFSHHPQAVEARVGQPPKDDSTHVVLPVFTYVERDVKGNPFFVAIPKEDANDAEKVIDAVMAQLRRIAPELPEDVLEEQRAALRVKATPDETSTTAGENENSAPASPIVHEVTQPPLFHLCYVANLDKPVMDLEGWNKGSVEPLADRSARLASQTPSSTWPLVYRGGALLCAWDYDAARQYLPNSADSGHWGSPDALQEVDGKRAAAEKAEAKSGPRKRAGKQGLSIEDCLDEFTREEKLGEEDPWYCPDCKEFRQATKKFDLWKVPDILVVHLKRFSAGRGLRDKIDVAVDFPIEGLDLTHRVEGTKALRELAAQTQAQEAGADASTATATASSSSAAAATEASANVSDTDSQPDTAAPTLSASILSAISSANDESVTSDSPIYDLFAVDNHFGGLGGGHYTAAARNAEDGQWYYFDDSRVSKIHDVEREVKGEAAYVLFYRRRTKRVIGGKSREMVRLASATPSGVNTPHNEAAEAGPSGTSGTSSISFVPASSLAHEIEPDHTLESGDATMREAGGVDEQLPTYMDSIDDGPSFAGAAPPPAFDRPIITTHSWDSKDSSGDESGGRSGGGATRHVPGGFDWVDDKKDREDQDRRAGAVYRRTTVGEDEEYDE